MRVEEKGSGNEMELGYERERRWKEMKRKRKEGSQCSRYRRFRRYRKKITNVKPFNFLLILRQLKKKLQRKQLRASMYKKGLRIVLTSLPKEPFYVRQRL